MIITHEYEVVKVTVQLPSGTFESHFSADGVSISASGVNFPVPQNESGYRAANCRVWNQLPAEARAALFPRHNPHPAVCPHIAYVPAKPVTVRGDVILMTILLARERWTAREAENFTNLLDVDLFSFSGVAVKVRNSASATTIHWDQWEALMQRQPVTTNDSESSLQ